MGQGELMSSGSKWIPVVRKARAWKKRVKTMMTELDLFKEFAICSIDEFRDEKNQNGSRDHVLSFWKKHLAWICQFPRGVLQLQSVFRPAPTVSRSRYQSRSARRATVLVPCTTGICRQSGDRSEQLNRSGATAVRHFCPFSIRSASSIVGHNHRLRMAQWVRRNSSCMYHPAAAIGVTA